ncbi:RDD family protein [Fusibacter sp. JL216-2]|uniref:RDD family protein n=1 Tax=Fusibacter sp. JL216-2 TaxID=3071453 RepID=UPI003D34DF80
MNIGFKKRLIAWLIDFAITSLVGIVAAISAASFIGVELGPVLMDEKPMVMAGVYFFLPLIIDWLYFTSFHSSKKQATIGKQVMKIVVTSDMGDRLTFGRATLRYVVKALCIMTLGFGFIPIKFTKRKQGLHDLFAGTVVVDGECCDHSNVTDLLNYVDSPTHKKAK